MCGIAGIITRDAGAASSSLSAMVACQAHRGPDDQGIETVRCGPWTVGLGQRRLSIIDLSPAGHQPMVNAATGDVLTYNGELYNFQGLRRELEAEGVRFRGHSDTEVILHALGRWGPGSIDRMCGMYALAFYNARARTLLLARDPLGIKPLYIGRGGDGTVVFASEVRAVLASGVVSRDVNRGAVAGLLAYGAVQEPATFYAGVAPVPRGAVQEIDLSGERPGEARTIGRWRFPAVDESWNEARAVEAVKERLEIAVRDHLIADVPVGVFLSSGLDSTIMAGLAARHTERLRTFTVGFADNADMSEAALTKQTAADLGVEHNEIQVTGAEALASVRAWLGALDQPSMDGLNVYVISEAVRKRGIVVALSGQGGDELFGGYPSFADVPRAAAKMKQIAWMPAPVRAGLAGLATMRRPAAVRMKAADMARSGGSLRELYLHRRRAMSDGQLAELGIEAGGAVDASFLPAGATDDVEPCGDEVATIARLESRLYMGNMLLRDGDANGMAHSLEIRVPFLDRRVIDLAYSIPGRVLLPEGKANKHLLRRAFGPLVRPELASLAKRGFVLPIRRWMTGPLRETCETALAHLRSSGFVRPAGVDAVWSRFIAEPESPIWSRAFTLVVLGSYLGRHR